MRSGRSRIASCSESSSDEVSYERRRARASSNACRRIRASSSRRVCASRTLRIRVSIAWRAGISLEVQERPSSRCSERRRAARSRIRWLIDACSALMAAAERCPAPRTGCLQTGQVCAVWSHCCEERSVWDLEKTKTMCLHANTAYEANGDIPIAS